MGNLVETIVNHDSVFGKRGREMVSLRTVLGQVRRPFTAFHFSAELGHWVSALWVAF